MMSNPGRRAIPARPLDDRGDTLIEILVSVVVIGLAVTAILGALLTSTTTSGSHKNTVTLDAIVKSLADSVRNQIETAVPNGSSPPQFSSCVTSNTYQVVGSAYPRSGPAGSIVTVFGIGFSSASAGSTYEAILTSTSTGQQFPESTTFTSSPSQVVGGAQSLPGAVSQLQTTGLPTGTYTVTAFDLAPGIGSTPTYVSPQATNTFTVTASGAPSTATPYNSYTLTPLLQYWTGSQWSGTCPGSGSSLQRLTLKMVDSGNGNGAFEGLSITLADFAPLSLDATSTSLSTSSLSPEVGVIVVYTATVLVITGTGVPPTTDSVVFEDGSSPIACGAGSQPFNGTTATCDVSYGTTTGGKHVITAMFNGDSTYSTSTSTAVAFSVQPDGTATTVTSSTNPAVTGQTLTYTAHVSVTPPASGMPPPTDTVTFQDGSNAAACGAGSQSFNGTTATCVTAPTTAGTHSITATFSGDSVYATSTTSPLTEVVNPASTTTAVNSSTNGSSVVGQLVTYTATVSVTSPGGGTPSSSDAVTFTDGKTTISCGSGSQSFDGTTATCNVAYSGTSGSPHSIKAIFGGDANYGNSTSPAVSQTVSAASTSISVGASPGTTVTHPVTVTYTATVSVTAPGGGTPSSSDSITFKDGTSTIHCAHGSQAFNGTTSTCIVSYTSTGTHSITAFFGGDTNYLQSDSSTSPLNETVN